MTIPDAMPDEISVPNNGVIRGTYAEMMANARVGGLGEEEAQSQVMAILGYLIGWDVLRDALVELERGCEDARV